jgi:hypothetical protein
LIPQQRQLAGPELESGQEYHCQARAPAQLPGAAHDPRDPDQALMLSIAEQQQ